MHKALRMFSVLLSRSIFMVHFYRTGTYCTESWLLIICIQCYISNSASDRNDISHLYVVKKRAFKCQLKSLKNKINSSLLLQVLYHHDKISLLLFLNCT